MFLTSNLPGKERPPSLYLFSMYLSRQRCCYLCTCLFDYCAVFLLGKLPPFTHALTDGHELLFLLQEMMWSNLLYMWPFPHVQRFSSMAIWVEGWRGGHSPVLPGLTDCFLKWAEPTRAVQTLASTWYRRLFNCCQAAGLGMVSHCCLYMHF